ncbi:MAG: geranylgeranylglycerol-phosphate geranylgeranyltransferase [Bacteroidales bacterium]|nr:geranylgeranylglycerol-phosphate geranylgeranyltransferase [Bacteroidales bacterium]
MEILRLVRYKNLLIVAATMVLVRYFIMQPILHGFSFELQLGVLSFVMLVLATVLITAAGYVINDYFDTRTDLVNRPQTVVVGKSVSRRLAIAMHMGMSVLGIALGLIVAIKVGRPIFSLLFVLAAGVLWFYSTTYKRQLIIGNLVVALLTGLVPLIPLIFEYPLFDVYWDMIALFNINLNRMVYWVGGYALFAFLLTLVREIIKDIEDFEGDTVYGRNTLPVHFGIQASKIIASSLLMTTLIVLIFLFARYMQFLPSGKFDYYTFIYFVLFILIPIFALFVMLLLAHSKTDYHKSSRMCKLIMLFGLLYTLIFRWLIL